MNKRGTKISVLWLAGWLLCTLSVVSAQTQPNNLTASIRQSLQRSQSYCDFTQDADTVMLPAPNEAALALFAPQSGRKLDPAAQPQTQTQKLPPLTLTDVLRLVEENHPKLRGVDVQRRAASAKRLEKQGAFDPVFTIGSDYLRFNSTTTRGRNNDFGRAG
jgi:hypothetical protein